MSTYTLTTPWQVVFCTSIVSSPDFRSAVMQTLRPRAASQGSDPGEHAIPMQQSLSQADLVFAQPLEELDPSDTEQEKVATRPV